MQKVVLKEGPCAPLFCLGAAILLAATGTVYSQTVERSDLERCASLETAERKLACFELLANIEDSEAQSATDAIPDRQPASIATNKALANAGATAASTGSDARRMVPTLAEEDVLDLTDNLGREQLNGEKDVNKKNAVVRATVNEVLSGNHDALYFHFANGQIWRQIEPRKFRYPRSGVFDVMIDRGMMGDYRLRLNEKSPMTRIKRVQ